MDMELARFNMIEQQIRPWNVMDAHVLELLEVVKREDFVPLAHKALAFVDMEIPLREGGARGQVMLAPRVEARLLQDANVQKHEKVLEIGAGSGYMAALLAHRAQRVVSLEIEPELARMARANLQKAGIHNAEVLEIDGAAGVKGDGPFDVIVLSGSVVEVPQVLMAQVKIGGRLIGIVGDEPMMYATVLTRTGESTWTTVQQWDTVVPR
ncbi:MAG: protein-L-isoaspartate O-methyltransferase, partial [Burkholderiaceae bacterium]|nr:protein-L-isoaspartate O-methyltransferase [Burkholderiaceae bacterium]